VDRDTGHRVVFTGQFAPGERHVYAVEIAKR
jgi:hypothetical protein